jgi:hypothetical protein
MFGLPSMYALDNIQWIRENSEEDYCRCIQNLIARAPFGKRKFYIFTVIKRVDDVSGVKKMYHQPRLTKPEPLPGTTLMRVDPSDPGVCTILWTLPQTENMGLYDHGKIFGDKFVYDCVQLFKSDPASMMRPETDDPSEDEIRDIYRGLRQQKTQEG